MGGKPLNGWRPRLRKDRFGAWGSNPIRLCGGSMAILNLICLCRRSALRRAGLFSRFALWNSKSEPRLPMLNAEAIGVWLEPDLAKQII